MIEDQLHVHLLELSNYISHARKKGQSGSLFGNDSPLEDLKLFKIQDHERVADVLSRNLLKIASLCLLCLIGFTAAYFSIVRYDVR